MAVYVFGDSHAHYTFARCPDATIFWLGPRTMHRVGRDGAHFIPHLITPKVNDTIVLVFGEIDVRCHISRIARLKGHTVEHVINDLIYRYVSTVRATIEHFHIPSLVLVLGAPPPLDPIEPNPQLPTYGLLEERIQIRRMLNAVLKEHASTRGIGYVPIPKLYERQDGSMRLRLSDGHAHIAMDHAHHVCQKIGDRIGTPLRFDRPMLGERLRLSARRSWAFLRHDHQALWDLGRLSGRSQQHI